jgi:hypothetical protein
MEPHVIVIAVTHWDCAVQLYRDGAGVPTAGIVRREIEHGAVAFFDLQGGLRPAVWPR